MTDIAKFITDQLSVWPWAAANFRAMKSASEKTLEVNGLRVKVQCNPGRIRSSAADISPEAIAARPCFLCEKTRPEQQFHIPFEGRKGRRYHIQINPYPIFPSHLVIARNAHVSQSLSHCYVDMLDLARHLGGFTVFYNGPKSGASAPDHMHFQACPSGLMPLETAVRQAGESELEYLTSVQEARLYHYKKYARGIFLLRATTSKSIAKLFYRLTESFPPFEGETEARYNVLTWHEAGEYRTIVIFRTDWRPRHFSSKGPDHITLSVGCADAAGEFIVPVEAEFERVTAAMLSEAVEDVTITEDMQRRLIWRLTRGQEKIEVGIMSGSEINFEIISDGAGPQKVSYEKGKINYNGTLFDELFFDAVTPSSLFAEPTFILHDVTIGIDFHWERKQRQKFAGALKFIVQGEKVTAVNIVGVEDYLLSVISSEMKGSASVEFLKAHAVISRSWVMSQILKRRNGSVSANLGEVSQPDGETFIKWFDHDDHSDFDVCADDHCQRYQGLGGTVSANARKAVDQTWGEVLTYGGEICDARFSKCCGGRTELFSTCWEDRDYPYLASVEDAGRGKRDFCDTEDESVLAQVLNDYDLETKDFYRWTVEYDRDGLSELLRRRSGVDFGTIRDLIPVERGQSGRIKLLKIVGTRRTMTIGKELLIRRWLSESHLKSSDFEVEQSGDRIVLHGRGWGHGVGLCQIGAAVMASEGYSYREILQHYYQGSELTRR